MTSPIFLSYTSLNDFLRCKRAYYLKNVYRDPKTAFRLQIVSPQLTLGSTVHDAIRWYFEQPQQPSHNRRFQDSSEAYEQLVGQFKKLWQRFRLKRGGFISLEEEATFGKRGLEMLKNFLVNAHQLDRLAPLRRFPKYGLLEEVILTGNTDHVGIREDGSLRVVDFKTGVHDEDNPLQLHIYALLSESSYRRRVSSVAFWYLDREQAPREAAIDDLKKTADWLKQKAEEVKQAHQESSWICVKSPEVCTDCAAYSALLDGAGEFMFTDFNYKKLVYFLK